MKQLIAGCLCLVGFIAPAFAQTASEFKIDVPFAFHLGDVEMRSGQFQVSRFVTHSVVLFKSTETRPSNERGLPNAITSVINELGQRDTGASVVVVFNKYGQDRYFVSEIRYGNGSLHLIPSRTERELISSKLIAARSPEVVTIVARLGR